jgi:hypothetical protein
MKKVKDFCAGPFVKNVFWCSIWELLLGAKRLAKYIQLPRFSSPFATTTAGFESSVRIQVTGALKQKAEHWQQLVFVFANLGAVMKMNVRANHVFLRNCASKV